MQRVFDVTRVASGGLEVLDLQPVASSRGQAVVVGLEPEDQCLEVPDPATEPAVLDCQDRGGPYVVVHMTHQRLRHRVPFQKGVQDRAAAVSKSPTEVADGQRLPARRARGGRWQVGQKNEERFMKATRRIGVPQRRHGCPSWP